MPTGTPQNYEAVAVSSTSIRLTWAEPRFEEQNGVIQAYYITITELETSTTLDFEADGTDTLLIVNSLQPFYNYNCTIAAFTVGVGPTAYRITQTLPDCKSVLMF